MPDCQARCMLLWQALLQQVVLYRVIKQPFKLAIHDMKLQWSSKQCKATLMRRGP